KRKRKRKSPKRLRSLRLLLQWAAQPNRNMPTPRRKQKESKKQERRALIRPRKNPTPPATPRAVRPARKVTHANNSRRLRRNFLVAKFSTMPFAIIRAAI